MNNSERVSLGRQKKDEVFKPAEKKNNNALDLGDNTCKCAIEMRFSVFITGL